ncbi:MAG: methylated-DNA--[Proteobacteria bacterium]|nr:methylated-DNA--[protein]-cysteine S-methyltransferase [Pseudomonadota bacterium]
MYYKCRYKTPDGFSDILMLSDGTSLTGIAFEGSRDISKHELDCPEAELAIFVETRRWLDIYFSGKQPDFMPAYIIHDLTPFRREVLDEVSKIPFGQTNNYGQIAAVIARKRGIARMSAQAVGGAVGWNPLCIIIPCHRVLGVHGNLTGYGGGMANKIALLNLEGHSLM